MGDPGQVILDLLAGDGDAALPSLTREDLRALGDQPMLAHAGDEQWWSSLDQRSRELVAETAQRGLIARNLIVASDGDPPLLVADPVQVAFRARHEPAWLLVLGEPGSEEAAAPVQIVVSGIDLREHDTSAVLISARIEGIYALRLAHPAIAVDAVVDWLLRPPPADAPTVGRTVELMLPTDRVGDRVADVRAIVMGTGTQWVLSQLGANGEPGEPEAIDATGLRGWLVDSISSLALPV